jgi:transcription elongation GreA/GreB family factor
MRYTIIEGASNPDLNLINYQTPIARALLDHAVGAKVAAKLPDGAAHVIITFISQSDIQEPSSAHAPDIETLVLNA